MNHHTFTTDLLIGNNTVDVEVTVDVEPYEQETRDCPGVAGGPCSVIRVVTTGRERIDLTGLLGDQTREMLLSDAADRIEDNRIAAQEARADYARENAMGW